MVECKTPNCLSRKILRGESPEHEGELLSAEEKESERIMLRMRIPGGLTSEIFLVSRLMILASYLEAGDFDPIAYSSGSLTLTRKGRLIADRIVRDLLLERVGASCMSVNWKFCERSWTSMSLTQEPVGSKAIAERHSLGVHLRQFAMRWRSSKKPD
jgi:hypothetical protein